MKITSLLQSVEFFFSPADKHLAYLDSKSQPILGDAIFPGLLQGNSSPGIYPSPALALTPRRAFESRKRESIAIKRPWRIGTTSLSLLPHSYLFRLFHHLSMHPPLAEKYKSRI